MTDSENTPTPDEQPAAPDEQPVKKAAAKKAPAKKAAAKKTAARKAPAKKAAAAEPVPAEPDAEEPKKAPARARKRATAEAGPPAPMVLFQPPETPEKTAPPRKRAAAKKTAEAPAETETPEAPEAAAPAETAEPAETGDTDTDGEGGAAKRRPRRRGGRRRRKSGGEDGAGENAGDQEDQAEQADQSGSDEDSDDETGEGSRRRRRRRRSGEEGSDDSGSGSTRARKPRNPEDEITSLQGSTRLAAKKQRRQEGREAGRRRAPIVSEAEFLARREAVDRVMVIRQHEDLTQIGVLEDKVLVEHYVARESQTSLIGNVYLGRVQNVLPSMEAAFVDIGKGRNAVLYAGEVNWSGMGHKDGQPRKIESVLSSGQTVLVQVSKDPIGHKGARLTGQISLPGRFLVYVPDGNTSGISRKLPDTERNRLKTLLKEIVPDSAGVIVRTAAEGASEDELTRDVERLTARWSDIEAKVKSGKSPELLYGEPDLTLKVVRDLFTEDFTKLVIQGDDAWDLVDGYVSHVAPDLRERLERFSPGEDGKDLFAAYRVDEQIAKGLDRKVWLPSGGSLVIDRTEAMTVVDVNTGKFTGSGGNLEETVTKNNLEAAEEIVRQLRLRDIGGIIVIDFIDMVLESNRDLVLRRLVECLGRDRTRHQVAEVTSLGLVQMTRKRIGTGLLEAFSHECEHCKGRGLITRDHPVEPSAAEEDSHGRRSRGGGGGGGRGRRSGGNGANGGNGGTSSPEPVVPSPKVLAGTRPHPEEEIVAPALAVDDDVVADAEAGVPVEDVASATPELPEEVPEEVTEEVTEAGPPPAPTTTVTTRRRTARRPAGPPVAAEVTPEEPDADSEDASSLVHVPVKRKGSRKR